MLVCETTTYATVPVGDSRSRHMDFLREYGDKGKIVMAGRFADAKGAMVIWNVSSLDEAKKLAEKDPYLKEGLLKNYELREWPVLFNYTVKPPILP